MLKSDYKHRLAQNILTRQVNVKVAFYYMMVHFILGLLRPRSVSVSVLAIRDLRASCPRTDPSTSGATPKLVTGGWSGFLAKSKSTSGPIIRDSITMFWPSLMISLPSISPGPRRNVISPAIEFNVVLRQIGVGSSYSASSSIAVIDLSCRVADLFNNR